MIFVNNITDLSYYHDNPQWGCYGEPILQPTDILLQANGFNITSPISGASVFIYVCDLAGVFQEDATAYFTYNLRSIVIGGTTYYYYNIAGSNFSPYMVANRCFTLRVIVTDGGGLGIVFDKYTEKYEIRNVNPALVEPTLLIDGVSQVPCIPFDNPQRCIAPGSGLVDVRVSFGCIDAYNGDIYGEGTIISNTGEPFLFIRRSLVGGRMRPIPSTIIREVSINCRTQRTEITPMWEFQGASAFPEWKMLEIEGMLLAPDIYIDGQKFQSDGGMPFEQAGPPVNCQYVYRLKASFNLCKQWQVYGCAVSCESLASYYAIPRPFSRVYDDALRLVAEDVDGLLQYFSSIPGTTVAVDTGYILPCPNEAVLKVQSSGVLPKYLYLDQPIPSQRVFSKQLPSTLTNVSVLCNGITNNNQVITPVVTGEDDEAIQVTTPNVISEDDVSANAYTAQIGAATDWTLDNNFTSGVSFMGEVTLNLSLSTGVAQPYSMNYVATISGPARPTADRMISYIDNGNVPYAGVLQILTTGEIYYTGPATSQNGNTYFVELFMLKYPL